MAAGTNRVVVGADNHFHTYGPAVASSSLDKHPGCLVADDRLDSFWKPVWAVVPPPDEDVTTYPSIGQLLGGNWAFHFWSRGAAFPPDGWVVFGDLSVVVNQAGVNNTVGDYSCHLQRNGADGGVSRSLLRAGSEKLRGKVLPAGAWLTSDGVATAYIEIDDGVSAPTKVTSLATVPTWVPLTHIVAPQSVGITLRTGVEGADGDIWVDGAIIVDPKTGAVANPTPHAVSFDYWAMARHGQDCHLGTSFLEWSDDNFATTNIVDSHLATNGLAWLRSFPTVTAKAIRVRVSGGDQAATLAMVNVGVADLLPRPVQNGFAPNDKVCTALLASNRAGNPMGRATVTRPFDLELSQPRVLDTEITGALAGVLGHLFDQGRPAFFQWSPVLRPNDVLVGWVPTGGRLPTGIQPGLYADINIPLVVTR